MQRFAEGSPYAVVRDPFGAVLALSAPEPGRSDRVAWHLLHAQDHERAFDVYASLFGWTPNELVDLGPALGTHRMFSWDESRRTVGSVANTARLPHVHPHWLFFFAVDDIEASVAKVRELGGNALEPTRNGGGDRMTPCHDALGAAFGLHQSSTR